MVISRTLLDLREGSASTRVTDGNLTAGDGAREAAEVRVRTAHVLNGETQFLQAIRARDFDALQGLEQRAAAVPGRFLRAAHHDVDAVQRAHRNDFNVGHAQLVGIGHELGGDGVETCLVVVDAVHLVDREDDVLHA